MNLGGMWGFLMTVGEMAATSDNTCTRSSQNASSRNCLENREGGVWAVLLADARRQTGLFAHLVDSWKCQYGRYLEIPTVSPGKP
jgi:hypothetical protein